MKLSATHFASQWFKELLRYIYPAQCLHCEVEVEKLHHPLCKACLSQIEWIDPAQSCIKCGVPLDREGVCGRCRTHPVGLQPHISLFSPLGPILNLHRDFLRNSRADLLASFVVVGLNRLSWPDFDCVVPLLLPRSEGFFLKKQPSFLIAKSVAKLFKCPCYFPGEKVEEKRVLIVSDRLENEELLCRRKEELKMLGAQCVYSLALIDQRVTTF